MFCSVGGGDEPGDIVPVSESQIDAPRMVDGHVRMNGTKVNRKVINLILYVLVPCSNSFSNLRDNAPWDAPHVPSSSFL